MIKSKNATSIVEAMVVMLIVVTATVGIYQVYLNSFKLQISTANRITGIQIAREWIEAMHNIRDTNAMLFSSDLANCWNTLNYSWSCIGNSWTTSDIWHATSYITYKDTDNRWKLTQKTTWTFWVWNYINDFRVQKDSLWFFTQSGWMTVWNFLPVYTREIRIDYVDTDIIVWPTSNDEKMKVSSIVRWSDSTKPWYHEIIFDTTLSNWRNKE